MPSSDGQARLLRLPSPVLPAGSGARTRRSLALRWKPSRGDGARVIYVGKVATGGTGGRGLRRHVAEYRSHGRRSLTPRGQRCHALFAAHACPVSFEASSTECTTRRNGANEHSQQPRPTTTMTAGQGANSAKTLKSRLTPLQWNPARLQESARLSAIPAAPTVLSPELFMKASDARQCTIVARFAGPPRLGDAYESYGFE